MTSNADNAMARFLFAILKQKNLKDVSGPMPMTLVHVCTDSWLLRLIGTKLPTILFSSNPLPMAMPPE